MLDQPLRFDNDSFAKMLQTCVGIANVGRGAKGYVLVGIVDKLATASRVETLYGVKPRIFEGFYVTGVDHEALAYGKTNDQFFQIIIEKVRNSPVSEPLRGYLARHLKAVRYYDRTVYVFDSLAQEDPSQYDGVYFERCGNQLTAVKPENTTPFIKRYLLGG